MKKIMLGLFLTVGVSAIAIANSSIAKTNNFDFTKSEQVSKIKNILDSKITVDCWYGTITNYYNSSGELTASTSIGYAAACLPGDADGTISIKVRRVIEGITPP